MSVELSKHIEDRKRSYVAERSRLRWWAIGATVAYVAGVLVLTAWRWPEISLDLSLDELGNFVGGFAAPLALGWLVIGYWQQNIELSLNTEMLMSQLEEMRQSLQQQTRQASSIEQNEAHARRDTILKLFDLYLNRLSSSLSVIIARAFAQSTNWLSHGWQCYSSGDKDYFFRMLLLMHTNRQESIVSIRAAINNSLDAREAAKSFVLNRDQFLRQLKELDSEGVFAPLIESGHVGAAFKMIDAVLDESIKIVIFGENRPKGG